MTRETTYLILMGVITISNAIVAIRMFLRKKSPMAKPEDRFPIQTEYPVEPYFTCGGKQYYRYMDTNNLPAGRALAALKYYIQLKTNCDEQFLRYYHKAMEATLADQKAIKLERLFELKNMLGDRLTWAFHPGIIMNYAAVLYLEEGENPYTFDEELNRRKVEHWKANASAEMFFFAEPFLRLIPYSTAAGDSPQTYSHAIVEADLLHHKKILQLLSSMMTSSADVSSLSLQITALEMLRDYVASRQTNTSYTSSSGIQLSKS